jgi:hypothetical protein
MEEHTCREIGDGSLPAGRGTDDPATGADDDDPQPAIPVLTKPSNTADHSAARRAGGGTGEA